MTRQIQKLVMAVAALAALALGGAVFAQAQTPPKAAQQHTSAPDQGNVQSGNQSTPDTAGSAAEQTGTEQSSSESANGSDGPGGHADEPGNPNADHQSQGSE